MSSTNNKKKKHKSSGSTMPPGSGLNAPLVRRLFGDNTWRSVADMAPSTIPHINHEVAARSVLGSRELADLPAEQRVQFGAKRLLRIVLNALVREGEAERKQQGDTDLYRVKPAKGRRLVGRVGCDPDHALQHRTLPDGVMRPFGFTLTDLRAAVPPEGAAPEAIAAALAGKIDLAAARGYWAYLTKKDRTARGIDLTDAEALALAAAKSDDVMRAWCVNNVLRYYVGCREFRVVRTVKFVPTARRVRGQPRPAAPAEEPAPPEDAARVDTADG